MSRMSSSWVRDRACPRSRLLVPVEDRSCDMQVFWEGGAKQGAGAGELREPTLDSNY